MNKTLTNTNTQEQFSLAPQTFDQLMTFGDIVAKSGMCPKDYIGKPGNVVVAIQMGQEIGLKPMQSLQNISVINGRPSLWGDALLALVKKSNVCEYIQEEISPDGRSATCTVKRIGEPKAQQRSFSLEDAKLAGLLGKDNWRKYPKRMLQLRARAWALRDVFPDVLAGMQVAEEMEDFHYTQEQEVKQAPKTLEQIGLSTSEKEGKLIVEGNTYGKTDMLKELGFTYENKQWFKELPKTTQEPIEEAVVEDNQVQTTSVDAENIDIENIDIENIDEVSNYLASKSIEFDIEDGKRIEIGKKPEELEEAQRVVLRQLKFRNSKLKGLSKIFSSETTRETVENKEQKEASQSEAKPELNETPFDSGIFSQETVIVEDSDIPFA